MSTLFFCNDSGKGQTIIRPVQDSDLELVKALAIKTFSVVNQFTTQEQVDALAKVYDVIIAEEQDYLKKNKDNMVALVAAKEDRIIGYFSAHKTNVNSELYARCFMVDPAYQNRSVGKKLLQQCRAILPAIKKVTCLTNKKNNGAQKLYEYFGAKRIENPDWAHHLYSNLKPSDYVGYEFDQKAISRFD